MRSGSSGCPSGSTCVSSYESEDSPAKKRLREINRLIDAGRIWKAVDAFSDALKHVNPIRWPEAEADVVATWDRFVRTLESGEGTSSLDALARLASVAVGSDWRALGVWQEPIERPFVTGGLSHRGHVELLYMYLTLGKLGRAEEHAREVIREDSAPSADHEDSRVLLTALRAAHGQDPGDLADYRLSSFERTMRASASFLGLGYAEVAQRILEGFALSGECTELDSAQLRLELSRIALRRGEVDEAAAILERVSRSALRSDPLLERNITTHFLAVSLAQGIDPYPDRIACPYFLLPPFQPWGDCVTEGWARLTIASWRLDSEVHDSEDAREHLDWIAAHAKWLDSFFVDWAKLLLGVLSVECGDVDQATELFTEVLPAATFDRIPPELADRIPPQFAPMALVCRAWTATPGKADELLERAIHLSDDHPGIQGRIWALRGDRAAEAGCSSAISYLERAVPLLDSANQPRLAARVLSGIAALEPDTQRGHAAAHEAARRTLAVATSISDPYARICYREERSRVIARPIQIHLEQGEVSQALEATYRLKSGDYMYRAGIAGRSRDVAVPEQLLETVSAASARAAEPTTEDAPTGFLEGSEIDEWISRQHLAIWNAFERPAGLAESSEVKVENVLKSLPQDHAAVEYLFLWGELVIFVLHEHELKVIRRPSSYELHKSVLDVVPMLQGKRFGGNMRGIEARLRLLHRALIEPLGDLPDQIRRLHIAPGSTLCDLPFAALISDDDVCLGDRVTLSMLISTADLTSHFPKSELETALVLRGIDSGDAPLIRANQECLAVRTALRNTSIELLDEVNEDSLRRCDLLHYAGHTSLHFVRKHGMLKLANDSPLQLEGIANLRFDRHPVVVLSSCKSATSGRWGFEIGGIVESFLHAGARAVVCSGWDVRDDAAEQYMVRFYRALFRYGDPATAVDVAARKLRQSPEYAHPYYWANFRCFGAS